MTQPYLVGNLQKDSAGEWAVLTIPASLRVETESGIVSVEFTTDALMTTVIENINTQMAGQAQAEDRNGALLVRTLGAGEGTFIRIHAEILGFDEASLVFGFPRHPDPIATARVGDQASSPPRHVLQGNGVGSKFIAFGEDRVASAYNRALSSVAENADWLYTKLRHPVAVPERIIVKSDAFWTPRVILNADGHIDQIDLTGLDAYDPKFAGRRVYVGNLSNLSSLDEISRHFAVLDQESNEIMVIDRGVRVSVLSRGLRPGATGPNFADDFSPSTSPLFDSAGTAPDGGNTLGVDRVKTTVAISEVLFNTTVRCPGETFITKLVREGDRAVISASTNDFPFNNNGTFVVETVVSEEELVLRPFATDSLRALNPDDSSGALGTLTISSGGEFQDELFVSFDPPMTGFPENGEIHLLLGFEKDIGDLSPEAILTGAIKSSEEVDTYVQLHIQRQISMDGAYDGSPVQAGGRGSGFYANIDDRPMTLGVGSSPIANRGQPSQGTLVSSGTGAVLAGNVLEADVGTLFTLEDTGRTVRLLTGPGGDGELFTIAFVLDPQHVRLAPYRSSEAGTVALPVGGTTFEVRADVRNEMDAALHVVSEGGTSDQFGRGLVYDRRYPDSGTTDPEYGQSFVHMERVRLHTGEGNISVFDITFVLAGTEAIDLPFVAEDSYNIWPSENSSGRGSFAAMPNHAATLIKIHNGIHAGIYRVDGTAGIRLILMNLDGTSPAFTPTADTIRASFYNIHAATKQPLKGGSVSANPFLGYVVSGLHLYQDNEEGGYDPSPALSLDWRGTGFGLGMWINDPAFGALASGDGAVGPAIHITGWAPARGIETLLVAEPTSTALSDNRTVWSIDAKTVSNRAWLDEEGPGYVGFQGWGARIWQGGVDPALLVHRVAHDQTVVPSDLAGWSHAAAVKIANATNVGGQNAGQGSAIETLGSIYSFRSKSIGPVAYDDGGVFAETVVAARWIYPLHSGADEHYYGNFALLPNAFAVPTRLGTAGIINPLNFADPDPTGDIFGPDYLQFNLPHDLMIISADFAAGGVSSVFVGLRIYITSGTKTGEEFYVVAASGNVLALRGPSTMPGGAGEGVDYQLRGQRWHRAYLNVADYMQVGIQDHIFAEELAPTIHKGPISAGLVTDSIDSVTGLQQLTTEGIHGDVQAFPNVDGGNVAEVKTLAAMGDFLGGPAVNHWDTAAGEPRSPFPNWDSVRSGVELGTVASSVSLSPGTAESADGNRMVQTKTAPGSLLVDDFVLWHNAAASLTTHGVVMYWRRSWGGCLRIETDDRNLIADGADQGDIVSVVGRGIKGVSKATLAIEVSAIVHWTAPVGFGHLLSFELVFDDGTLFRTSGLYFYTGAGGTQEFVHTFQLHDLNNQTHDYMQEMMESGSGIHPAVKIIANNGFSGFKTEMNLLRFTNKLVTRSIKQIGGLDVQGTVLAHSFRHQSPVTGFDTINPLRAEVLNGAEFAYGRKGSTITAGLGLSADAWYEGLGLVGLLKRSEGNEGASGITDALWYEPAFSMHHFFRKSPDAATIDVYHPYFDPLWYRSVRPDASKRVAPTRTGFLIPLEPPHGSVLTSITFGLAFRMALMARLGASPGIKTAVWHTNVQGTAVVTVRDEALWDAASGVIVRIWRHHCLPQIGAKDPYGAAAIKPVDLIELGYAEQIHNENIDVPAAGMGGSDFTALFIDGNNEWGDEKEIVRTINLRDVLDKDHAIVDRRHFTYSMTIEFYAGTRFLTGSDYFYEPSNGTDRVGPEPHVVETVTLNDGLNAFDPDWEFTGRQVLHRFAPDWANSQRNQTRGPAVKFRGARLAWTTTRGPSGGWG
jgi:hypothetical protein